VIVLSRISKPDTTGCRIGDRNPIAPSVIARDVRNRIALDQGIQSCIWAPLSPTRTPFADLAPLNIFHLVGHDVDVIRTVFEIEPLEQCRLMPMSVVVIVSMMLLAIKASLPAVLTGSQSQPLS